MSEKKVIKSIVWNENRIKASEALKSAEKPLTLDEINEKGGCRMVSGSVQALTACGVWEIVGETTKSTKVKGHVNRYKYVSDECISKGGNEKQKAIVKALKDSPEPLTLKDISKCVGFEVKSGTANTLREYGAIEVVDKIEVSRVRAKGRPVKLYRLNVEKYNDMRKKEA